MKKLPLLPVTCALFALATVPAFAAKADGPKAKAVAKYDTNKDGKLSDEEIAAIVPGAGKKSDKADKKAGKKSGGKKSAEKPAKN